MIALSGPTTIDNDFYRGTRGTRKKRSLFADGRIMDQSLSRTVQSHVIYQMICAEQLKNHYSLI